MGQHLQLTRWRNGRIPAVSLMLALWVSLSLVSTLPRLHHWFHQDSASPSHECAITTLSKNIFVSTAHGLQTEPSVDALLLPASSELLVVSTRPYSEPPGRGPPALSVLPS